MYGSVHCAVEFSSAGGIDYVSNGGKSRIDVHFVILVGILNI